MIRSKRGKATYDKHKNFTEKNVKTLGVTLEKTMSTESDDSPLEVSIKKKIGEDLTNQNLHVDSEVQKCLANQESPTLDAIMIRAGKEATNQETHELITVVKKRVSRQETMLHNTHKVLTAIQKATQEFMIEDKITENIQGISSEDIKEQQINRDSRMVQNEGTNQKTKKINTLYSQVQKKISNHKSRDQFTATGPSPEDQIDIQNLVQSPKKEPNISICEPQINYPRESANVKIQIDHKEGQTEITKQGSTTAKAYMTPTSPQKDTFSKQKVTLNKRMQKTMDKENPKPETQNKQFHPISSNRLEESRHSETQEQIRPRKEHNTLISQQGMNILKMDYKKPAAASRDIPHSTTVVVEHAKAKCTSHEDVRNVCRHSHRFAKCLLAEEVETWEGETNTVVKITREMAAQMSYMIQYLERKGPIKSSEQFIASAKYIATLGQTFVKFIGIMAKNCADERNTRGLLCGMEQVQTLSNQLSIISSVKAATGFDDYSAEDVLLKNAQNLIHSILQTWKAAEAACIKSTENPIYSKDEEEVAAFSSQLRRKLLSQRAKEPEY
ncbi:uncharacterized protein LOC122936316 [Bufo gargarizans]|uniref:uncharacterized protein LOC122936316 n=1 Tax=Bufo gargarizans TaxID=30331 RepID=UPI001CF2066A|nr:uncharacterized protein LOC122936316 [Bufo gargarizans]